MTSMGTVYPEHQVAYLGGAANITCNSATPPKWTRNGMQQKLFSAMRHIQLINLTYSMSGVYTCYGTLNSDGKDPFSASAQLLVGGEAMECISLWRSFDHNIYFL